MKLFEVILDEMIVFQDVEFSVMNRIYRDVRTIITIESIHNQLFAVRR